MFSSYSMGWRWAPLAGHIPLQGLVHRCGCQDLTFKSCTYIPAKTFTESHTETREDFEWLQRHVRQIFFNNKIPQTLKKKTDGFFFSHTLNVPTCSWGLILMHLSGHVMLRGTGTLKLTSCTGWLLKSVPWTCAYVYGSRILSNDQSHFLLYIPIRPIIYHIERVKEFWNYS